MIDLPPRGGLMIAGLAVGPDDPVLGIWFGAGTEQDWLAFIAVVAGHVRLVHRFRYYTDEPHKDPFAAKDAKRFYGIDGGEDTPLTRAKALEAFGYIAKQARQQYGFEFWHFPGGTTAEAIAWLKDQPFAHMQTEGVH